MVYVIKSLIYRIEIIAYHKQKYFLCALWYSILFIKIQNTFILPTTLPSVVQPELLFGILVDFSEANNVADVIGFMVWFRVVLPECGRWRQKDFPGCLGF